MIADSGSKISACFLEHSRNSGEATIHKRRESLDVMTNGVGLGGVYNATLDRIKGQGKGKSALAMATLIWISHSEPAIHIGELREALVVGIGSRDIE